jgi:diguanylate cyclase (GGDEF)-like protein
MYRVLACSAGEHDFRLVVVAALICASAAYTSFHIYNRVTDAPSIQPRRHRQLAWVGLTGLSTGAGIWSTHFVAMLAYDSGLPTAYDPLLTLLSMLVAISVTTVGYAIAGIGGHGNQVLQHLKVWGRTIAVTDGHVRSALGGAVIGGGISIMHYTGMAALRVPGTIEWDAGYVIASVVLGTGFAAAALISARRNTYRAPVLLTLAICLMHFTGMASATVIPGPESAFQSSSINTVGMASAVAGVTMLILLAAIAAALVNSQAEREVQLRQLIEAQRLGKMGDWSYRLGEREIWIAPEFHAQLRYEPSDIRPVRKALLRALVGDGAVRLVRAQAEVRRTGKVCSVDVKLRRGDGTIGDFMITTQPLRDGKHRVAGFAGTIQDISERKQAEEQLQKLAYYDPLTGLANRALFRREMDQVLARCARASGGGALLLLDLDRFKEVNDSLGHPAGDELLVKVAHLLARVLDKSHFLARLGGDEFAILTPDSDPETVAPLASKIVAAVSGSFVLERGEAAIGTSIGIALIPSDGVTSSDLLRSADLALYRAKEDGRGCFAFFKPEMNAIVQHKIALARELRGAMLEDGGLSVHYQPQVDLATGRVAGYEALMRWQHPVRGNIPPSVFIPIAESSRLIADLGFWILREAAQQAKTWLDAGEPPREVAVNVSAAQIWHTDLVSEVAHVLGATGLPPHLLCLELTESLLADHAEDRVRTVLKNLKALGVTLALDDFGTGYSSLGYLTQLPFDKLKVDRVFIHGTAGSTRSRELLKGIVALGRGLGMTVHGEGAETVEEVQLLKEFGCDLVQGFIFARPSTAYDALEFARSVETDAVHAIVCGTQPKVAA